MTERTPGGRWVRLSANYQMDPRIIAAGAHAELIYVRGLALSRQMGTDGHVSARHAAHLTRGLGRPKLILPKLVEVELWEVCADGWRVPFDRWEKWQTTEAEWRAQADAAAARQRASRAKKQAESSP